MVSLRSRTPAPFSITTYEVDADRGDVGLCVGVVGEPQQQARLADTGVTDEQQLEKVVVSGTWSATCTWWLQGVAAIARYQGDGRREKTLEQRRASVSKQSES
jgi:hypothetical protein